jgi:hypothetical protein
MTQRDEARIAFGPPVPDCSATDLSASAFQGYYGELADNGGMGTERLAHVAFDMNRHLRSSVVSP